MLGSRMSGIIYPLLVLSMGEGVVRAGLLGSCAMVAGFAFQLPAGHLADRFNQRQLMLSMDIIRMMVVGSVPLAYMLDHLTFPQLLAVALIEGAATSVFGSSAMVFLRMAVPPAQFSKAMSQSQTAYGATSLLGPTLGGALYGVDRILPFIADTASYAVSGALLLAVSVHTHQASGGGPVEGKKRDRRITAGLRWLLRQHTILRILLFGMALNLAGAASGIAAVILMSERGTPASVIGIVVACGGFGMVAGSLVSARVIKVGPLRLYVTSGILWTAALATLAASSSPWVVGTVLTLLAAIGPSTGVMLFQILADKAPKDMYGRVTAAQGLMTSSLAAAGPLLAGVLVATFGGTYLWLVLAGICFVATVLTIRPLLLASRRVADEAPSLGHAVAMAERT